MGERAKEKERAEDYEAWRKRAVLRKGSVRSVLNNYSVLVLCS